MTDDIDTLLNSFDRLDVACTSVSSDEFDTVLDDVIMDPVVGAPLPFDHLSLEGADVSTRPTPGELEAAQTGVTAARFAIASYGTLMIQSGSDATEAASLFPDVHVAVLRASDVLPTMTAAFERLGPVLRSRSLSAILATGPSATADMGALVQGAHGPSSVHVLLVEDR